MPNTPSRERIKPKAPFDAERMKRIEGCARWLVENHHNGQRQALAKAYLNMLDVATSQRKGEPSLALHPILESCWDGDEKLAILKDGRIM